MYLEGRWLDLRLLDAVEEDDSDPLSSLDIQVSSLSSSFYTPSMFFILSTSSFIFRCYALFFSHASDDIVVLFVPSVTIITLYSIVTLEIF